MIPVGASGFGYGLRLLPLVLPVVGADGSYYGYGWYPYYGMGALGRSRGGPMSMGCGAIPPTPAQLRRVAIIPDTGNYGAGSRGSGLSNTQIGRSTVAGRGYNTNIYTGNTAGFHVRCYSTTRNTGIAAGGGAG